MAEINGTKGSCGNTIGCNKENEVFEANNEEEVVLYLLKKYGFYDYENTNEPQIKSIKVYELKTASFKTFNNLDDKYLKAYTKYHLDKTEKEEIEMLRKLKEKYEKNGEK